MIYSIWGTINLPEGVSRYGGFSTQEGGGLTKFLTNIIMLLIIGAGIYAVFNFVLAGYAFLSASGDPKKVADAWAKIWQTMLGLVFVVGSLILGSILSNIIYGNPFRIFQVWVYGPT